VIVKKLISIVLLLNSGFALAHNGEDHIKTFRSNNMTLHLSVMKYESLANKDLQLKSLRKQIKILNQNLFILRQMMAKEYPHVKEAMSRYKIDYMKELDSSTKQLDAIVDRLQNVNGHD